MLQWRGCRYAGFGNHHTVLPVRENGDALRIGTRGILVDDAVTRGERPGRIRLADRKAAEVVYRVEALVRKLDQLVRDEVAPLSREVQIGSDFGIECQVRARVPGNPVVTDFELILICRRSDLVVYTCDFRLQPAGSAGDRDGAQERVEVGIARLLHVHGAANQDILAGVEQECRRITIRINRWPAKSEVLVLGDESGKTLLLKPVEIEIVHTR